ncbi:hypothetical protein SRHO_G00240950 [Serrasalmus rhombeus]
MRVQVSRGVGAWDSRALAWYKATGHSKKLNLSPLPAQSLSGEVYWCFVLSQLGEPKKKSLQMILEREKELAELQRAVDTHKRCAQAALQESEKIFDEMIRSIEKRRSEVQDLIKAQEKISVSRAEVFLKQLEEEIAGLRKRDEELQHLSLVEDHIHFLQRFVFLSAPPGTSDLPTITVSSAHSFDDVAKSVIQLKKRVDDFCKEDMERITTKVKQIQILTPMTREEVLQYFCDLTLDYNTAYRRLALYDSNKTVVNNDRDLTYPDHPDRDVNNPYRGKFQTDEVNSVRLPVKRFVLVQMSPLTLGCLAG